MNRPLRRWHEPTVGGIPAEANKRETAYYRERLENPSLTAASMAVLVDRYAYLDVLVGGRRGFP
ncbi:hypothetical protein ABT218_20605 [Streptomyces sp. NPDC001455]|uniref:hypothetical protein n=1 Tax=unclassified Streptomyces TaxID=2593676 RepID=UPI00332382A1